MHIFFFIHNNNNNDVSFYYLDIRLTFRLFIYVLLYIYLFIERSTNIDVYNISIIISIVINYFSL